MCMAQNVTVREKRKRIFDFVTMATGAVSNAGFLQDWCHNFVVNMLDQHQNGLWSIFMKKKQTSERDATQVLKFALVPWTTSGVI